MAGLPTDPIKRPVVGALNNDTSNEFGGITTDDTLNSTYALNNTVMSHLTSQNSLNNISYPRRAFCVYAETYEADPDNSFLPFWNRDTSFLGFNSETIRVKAYDDLLDAGIVMPNIAVSPNEWTAHDWANFNMMPWFYSTNAVSSVPAPGDIVIVDYTDRENNMGGIYLHPENSPSIMATVLPNGLAPARAAVNAATALFQSLFSSDPGLAPTQTPAFTSVADLCDGPVMERGSKFGGGEVETGVIDGCPVAKDVSGYYMTMKNAASLDGVTLRINSAFRGSDNAIIPEECGGGTKKGQAQLNADNCAQNPRKCDPATAADGRSRHQNGIAFDMQTGMPKDKYTPRPDAMTSTYKWLSFNAHIYGFYRAVTSERWHWEYWGTAKTQFSMVPKDHPTWDNLWTTEEGMLVLSGANPNTTPSPPVDAETTPA